MERDIEALLAFIEERLTVPHAWGRNGNDCMSFVAGAIDAQTGGKRKPLTGLKWSCKSTGMRQLAKLGGVEAALDARFQRIPPSMAHRGDIAGVPDADLGIHPMIVEGDMLVGPGDKGLRRLPRRAMTIAWSTTLPAPAKPKKAARHVARDASLPRRRAS
jgi:hypothetical protein